MFDCPYFTCGHQGAVITEGRKLLWKELSVQLVLCMESLLFSGTPDKSHEEVIIALWELDHM